MGFSLGSECPDPRADDRAAIPRVAADCDHLRREALGRPKVFVQSYRQALARFIELTRKELVVFPEGLVDTGEVQREMRHLSSVG